MTKLNKFTTPILYSQLLVHNKSHSSPGLIWEDNHVAQGFAWSEGLVSFGVPDHDGECSLEIYLANQINLDDNSIWAIQVPYNLKETIEVGTVGLMKNVEVPHGNFNLLFEAIQGIPEQDLAYVIKLTFVPCKKPEFAILRQGGELTTNHVLTKDAKLSI